MTFPTEWKVIKGMFQTTNQTIDDSNHIYIYYTYIYYIHILYIYIKDYPIYYGQNNPNLFPSIPEKSANHPQPKLDQDDDWRYPHDIVNNDGYYMVNIWLMMVDPRIRALLRAKHHVRLTHLHIAIPPPATSTRDVLFWSQNWRIPYRIP